MIEADFRGRGQRPPATVAMVAPVLVAAAVGVKASGPVESAAYHRDLGDVAPCVCVGLAAPSAQALAR